MSLTSPRNSNKPPGQGSESPSSILRHLGPLNGHGRSPKTPQQIEEEEEAQRRRRLEQRRNRLELNQISDSSANYQQSPTSRSSGLRSSRPPMLRRHSSATLMSPMLAKYQQGRPAYDRPSTLNSTFDTPNRSGRAEGEDEPLKLFDSAYWRSESRELSHATPPLPRLQQLRSGRSEDPRDGVPPSRPNHHRESSLAHAFMSPLPASLLPQLHTSNETPISERSVSAEAIANPANDPLNKLQKEFMDRFQAQQLRIQTAEARADRYSKEVAMLKAQMEAFHAAEQRRDKLKEQISRTTQRLGDDVAEIRKKQKDTDRMLRVQERRLQESQLNFPSLNGTLGNAFAEASGNDKHRPDKSTSSGTLSYAISCLIVGIATAVMPFLYLYRVTLSMMPQLNSSLFFPTHGDTEQPKRRKKKKHRMM